MSKSHSDVIKGFRNGKHYKGCNVYARDGVLYSYGPHFPLAVRMHEGMWLLNGDKYSVSTSGHQATTFTIFKDMPRVSFTACSAAIGPMFYTNTEVLDFRPDDMRIVGGAWDTIPVTPERQADFNASIPTGATVSIRREGNNVVYMRWHRIGQVLLRSGDYDYVCGMDESSYFVSRLPRRASNIDDAFLALQPPEVQYAELKGVEVKRQGEWFFIPCTSDTLNPPKHFKKHEFKQQSLPKDTPESADHIVKRAFYADGRIFVYGRVRHSRREHRVLDLQGWHLAVRNTALQSWSAQGRVD